MRRNLLAFALGLSVTMAMAQTPPKEFDDLQVWKPYASASVEVRLRQLEEKVATLEKKMTHVVNVLKLQKESKK